MNGPGGSSSALTLVLSCCLSAASAAASAAVCQDRELLLVDCTNVDACRLLRKRPWPSALGSPSFPAVLLRSDLGFAFPFPCPASSESRALPSAPTAAPDRPPRGSLRSTTFPLAPFTEACSAYVSHHPFSDSHTARTLSSSSPRSLLPSQHAHHALASRLAPIAISPQIITHRSNTSLPGPTIAAR
jgi:hypothetical protein